MFFDLFIERGEFETKDFSQLIEPRFGSHVFEKLQHLPKFMENLRWGKFDMLSVVSNQLLMSQVECGDKQIKHCGFGKFPRLTVFILLCFFFCHRVISFYLLLVCQ